jgi:hypothetical protein
MKCSLTDVQAEIVGVFFDSVFQLDEFRYASISDPSMFLV